MSTWDAQDFYYSGQGVVLLAERNQITGKPKGFYPVGNVSALAITVEVSTLEHKESHTGQRGTDLRLTTETNVGVNMTMENFISENLAKATRGTSSRKAAGSITSEPILAFPGAVTSLRNVRISSEAVKVGGVAMVPYTDDTTPYDFRVNREAGSIMFNDGAVLGLDKLGIVVTGVTVGATTGLTVANNLSIGDKVSFRGFTGADAAILNGVEATVVTASSSAITVSIDTTAKVITAGATTFAMWEGMPGEVDYSHESQYQVDAMTQGAREYYLRFEGLNTARENEPVVVEVFRFTPDPTQSLELISDTVQQFALEGSALADNLQLTGSKYFKVLKTN